MYDSYDNADCTRIASKSLEVIHGNVCIYSYCWSNNGFESLHSLTHTIGMLSSHNKQRILL